MKKQIKNEDEREEPILFDRRELLQIANTANNTLDVLSRVPSFMTLQYSEYTHLLLKVVCKSLGAIMRVSR